MLTASILNNNTSTKVIFDDNRLIHFGLTNLINFRFINKNDQIFLQNIITDLFNKPDKYRQITLKMSKDSIYELEISVGLNITVILYTNSLVESLRYIDILLKGDGDTNAK